MDTLFALMDNQSMDLNEVAIFIKVVQKGSFSAAAQALQMPRSTVSLKVLSLEKRLGVTLLKRTTRKLQLTDAGRRYFDRTTGAINELYGAETALLSEAEEPQGQLRITAPVDLGNYLFCELCSNFRKKYPKVSLDLILTDRVVNLLEEEIDIALRAGSLKDSSFKFRKLGEVWFAAFASPAYLKKRGIPKEPNDLAEHDCIIFTSISSSEWKLQKEKKTISIPISPKINVNEINLVHKLAIKDQGIALLPTFLVDSDISQGSLVRVLPEWRSHISPLQFVYPSQKYSSPVVEAFIQLSKDFIKSRFPDRKVHN